MVGQDTPGASRISSSGELLNTTESIQGNSNDHESRQPSCQAAESACNVTFGSATTFHHYPSSLLRCFSQLIRSNFNLAKLQHRPQPLTFNEYDTHRLPLVHCCAHASKTHLWIRSHACYSVTAQHMRQPTDPELTSVPPRGSIAHSRSRTGSHCARCV